MCGVVFVLFIFASLKSPGLSFTAAGADMHIARSYYSKRYQGYVRRFDHYCVWVNNDIGQSNHGVFYAFVTATMLHLAGAMVLGWWFYKEIDYMAMATRYPDLIQNDMFIIPPSMDGSRGPQLQTPDKMFSSVMTSLGILGRELGPATAILTVVCGCFFYSVFLWWTQTWHILYNITTLEYIKVAWHSPIPMPWNQGFKNNIWLFMTAWAEEDHFLLADEDEDDEHFDMETDEGVARARRKLESKGRPAVVKPVPVTVTKVVHPADVNDLPTAKVIGIKSDGMLPVVSAEADAIPAAGPTIGGATTAKKRNVKSGAKS